MKGRRHTSNILSQLNLLPTSLPYFFVINFNSILPPTLRYPKWSIRFRFSDQIMYAFLTIPCILDALPTSNFMV